MMLVMLCYMFVILELVDLVRVWDCFYNDFLEVIHGILKLECFRMCFL